MSRFFSIAAATHWPKKTEEVLQHYAPRISYSGRIQMPSNDIVKCPIKGVRGGAFLSPSEWLCEWVHMFGGAPNVFPTPSPSSIWSRYDCHSPARAAQHLFSCLFNPIYERAWLRWKGGEWWKLSCLFTSSSFHSSAKRVQAPNDTNSEMKAANLTVSGTELWCLAARCLLGLHSYRNQWVYNTA